MQCSTEKYVVLAERLRDKVMKGGLVGDEEEKEEKDKGNAPR